MHFELEQAHEQNIAELLKRSFYFGNTVTGQGVHVAEMNNC